MGRGVVALGAAGDLCEVAPVVAVHLEVENLQPDNSAETRVQPGKSGARAGEQGGVRGAHASCDCVGYRSEADPS